MDTAPVLDRVFEALADPYRRQLLVALLDHDSQDDPCRDPLNIVADDIDPETLEIELVHRHLPKLEKKGFIRWNQKSNEISPGPTWDEIEPLLALLDEHQEELPPGWP